MQRQGTRQTIIVLVLAIAGGICGVLIQQFLDKMLPRLGLLPDPFAPALLRFADRAYAAVLGGLVFVGVYKWLSKPS